MPDVIEGEVKAQADLHAAEQLLRQCARVLSALRHQSHTREWALMDEVIALRICDAPPVTLALVIDFLNRHHATEAAKNGA